MTDSKFYHCITRKYNKNLLYLAPALIWIAVVTLLNFFCSSHVINSDMSAELVLADELAKTNRIFTTQWFYSTEIRIFYTQIVSLFFFKIFNSWTTVRTLTNFVFLMLLLFSYLFAMKPLKLTQKSVYLSSLFLFIPYSLEYINIVHIGNSYIPHFIVVFVCIGFLIRLLGQKNRLYFLCYLLLSFYAGLCGIRFLTIYAIPVFLSSILKIIIENQKSGISLFNISSIKKPGLVIPFFGFTACFSGVIINSRVLSRIISVGSSNDLFISLLDDSGIINMIDTLIIGFLRLFGYNDFVSLNTLSGFASIASIIILAALVIICIIIVKNYHLFPDKSQYFILLFLMSFFTNTFIFIFIAGTYVPRFYMPVLILLTPYIALFLDEKQLFKYDFNKLTAIFLVIAMNISGIAACVSCASHDQNAPFKEVVNFLEENHLSFGLTTFWNTGVVNELSNGRIECVNIRDSDINQIFPWLTFKKYLDSETWENINNSQIFILLDSDIYDDFRQNPMILDGSLIYDENGYLILVYDKEYFIQTYGSQYFTN